MSFEAPKPTIEEQIAAMGLAELDALNDELMREKNEKEQEIAEITREETESSALIQELRDEITDLKTDQDSLKEELRILKEEQARAASNAPGTGTTSAGSGPTGVPPTGDLIEAMLREAEEENAAHADAPDPGRPTPAGADPAHAEEKYVWDGVEYEPTVDPKTWEKKTWNLLGYKWSQDIVNYFNEYQWMRVAIGLPIKILAKVGAFASFTTTPIEYFFHDGMKDKERQALATVIEAAQHHIKDIVSKDGGPTSEDEASVTEKLHAIETTIDGMVYVPQEWKDALKDRLKLLLKDYRQNAGWENDRYAKETARIIAEYVVSKTTNIEIGTDAANTALVAGSAFVPALLAVRGINSAVFSMRARYIKEQHTFDRTHWKEKRQLGNSDYVRERDKEAAIGKVLKKCSYEWLKGIGSIVWDDSQKTFSSKFFTDGGLNPFRNQFYKEKISFIQSLSTLARGAGVTLAAVHLNEMEIAPNIDRILQSYEKNGIGTMVAKGFLDSWSHSLDPLRKARNWMFGEPTDTSHQPTTQQKPIVVRHVIEHVEAPKIAFDIRNIRGLRDLGYVQKSSELYFDNRVHMREVDGVRFETKTVERWEGPRKILVEQIISLNNRNVGYPIDITSEKQFFDTINDPTHYEEPFQAPVKNVKFNYWLEQRPDGNPEFHRFWQKNDIDYEIKGTSIYKDATTGKLYALHPGEKVHSNDDPLQKLMEYRVVGVRMPDGSYHSVDVAINDPLHGKPDPNVGFNRLHNDVVAGKVDVDVFKAPRQPLPSDEVAPVKPSPAPKVVEKTMVVPKATPTKPVAPPVIIPPTKPAEVLVPSTAPAEVTTARAQPIVEPITPTPTSAATTLVETPPATLTAPSQPVPTEIIPPIPAGTTPPNPIKFIPSTGRGINPADLRSDARTYSSGSLRYAFGRTGRGADAVDYSHSSGGRSTQPYTGERLPPLSRPIDPSGPIGKDLREAIAAEASAGDFTATSSGRIVQKIFDREFLVEHGMKPGQLSDAQVSQLQNLKGNMRLLLEGKNIKSGDLPSITQDDLRKAVDVTHLGKTWSVDVKDEAQWKQLMSKLILRAQHNFPEHSIPTPRVDVSIDTDQEAPKNLPVAEEVVEAPQPQSLNESIGSILKNTTLSDNAQYRAVSSVIEKLDKGDFTLQTKSGDVHITKLGSGAGAFIRLPGETHSRFWSPTTAAAIEKLLRR